MKDASEFLPDNPKGPQRLTLVIPSLEAGGAERVLARLANRWAAQSRSVVLLTFDDGSKAPFYALDGSVAHRPLGLAGASSNALAAAAKNIARVRRLRRAIAESRPQAVVSFIDNVNVLALLAARGLGAPVVVSERTDPSMHRIGPFWNAARRCVYPLASAIVVQNEDVKRGFGPRLAEKISVIPNPVVAPPAAADGPAAAPTIAAMGRLGREKGFDLLIEAFARISPRRPEWELEILGEGPERAALEALAGKLGVAGKVRLPGLVQEPAGRLRRAQIFALPSRYEGFPNALCEAMACGLAVVAADCPSGPRAIVRSGRDGILVPPEDADSLASALERLMADPAERRKLGQNALEVVERFGLERVGGLWDELLERLPQGIGR